MNVGGEEGVGKGGEKIRGPESDVFLTLLAPCPQICQVPFTCWGAWGLKEGEEGNGVRRLLTMKLLRGFDGAKEPVATGGITTYPTGTGSGPAVDSDLRSFDADKRIPSKAGGCRETWGTGRWSFGPCSTLAEPRRTKQLQQIKASTASRRGQPAAAITRGCGGGVLIEDFIHLPQSHRIQMRPRSHHRGLTPRTHCRRGTRGALPGRSHRAEQRVCSSI